jgi:diguanylate cyclase (GGDEF)-like protein
MKRGEILQKTSPRYLSLLSPTPSANHTQNLKFYFRFADILFMRLADRAVIEVAQEENLFDQIKETAEDVWSSQWTQAGAWLLLAAVLDLLFAPGGAGRMLYLVPAWLLAERHSVGIAYVSVLAGALLHNFTGRGFEPSPLIGLVLQIVLGCAIVRRVDRHLQSAARYAQLAALDPLTGLMNRKALDAYAVREFERCQREGRPFTVAVIDCDKFKQINDVFGHAFGDEVLRLLAKTVGRELTLRRCRLGRTGGDEFVAILPGVPAEEAEYRLYRAAKAFSDATLVRGRGMKVTISVGFASNADSVYGLDRLLKDADDDMYRRKAAKNAGAAFGLPV